VPSFSSLLFLGEWRCLAKGAHAHGVTTCACRVKRSTRVWMEADRLLANAGSTPVCCNTHLGTSRLFDCNARCAGVAKGQIVWQTAATAGCDGDLQCLTFTSLSQRQWKGGLAEHPTSPSRRRALGPVCSVSRFSISDVFARPLGRLVIRTTLRTVAHDTHTHTRKDTGVSHGVDTSTTNTLVRECAHRKRALDAGERGGREGVAEGPLASSAEGSEREEGVFYSRWKQNTQAHTATHNPPHSAKQVVRVLTFWATRVRA
jgi:hypothetical protein